MPLTPIPSPTGGDGAAGAHVMPQFMSAIPIAPDSMPEDWFTLPVEFPCVPAVPVNPEIHTPATTGNIFAPLPAQKIVAAPQQPVLMPEIVLPAEKPPLTETAGTAGAPSAGSHFKTDPEYSDEDLANAFAPIVQAAVRRAVFENEGSRIDAFLEPMLRATVRRALAEYSPGSRPFRAPGFMDRTMWRLRALFSSRSYEDVLFEKTNRFQVEEVFLFDSETLALVSFASSDPARHSSPKRIESSAHRIAMKIRDEDGVMLRSFEQADGRNVIAEVGAYMTLVAIVRGTPNELMLADLGFSLHRIEDHFRERFQQAGTALMHALQPFLEDCLLIQAPASAA